MNHFVRTVNGERVVSQIQNDFTVSLVSLDVLPSYHGGTSHAVTIKNFDHPKTTIVYGNFFIIRYRYFIIIYNFLKDGNNRSARREIEEGGGGREKGRE